VSQLGLAVAAAVVAYLVGSVSFARLVARRAVPGADLERVALTFHEGSDPVVVEGVSATSVAVRAGRRWGVLVSLLDIAKAVIVTALFGWLDQGGPADLVAATFVVVGHIWPLWHRFRGGFGVSPMIGGLLVVDPAALIVTIALGLLVGLALADSLIAYDGWTLLLAPWFLLVRGDPAEALYALVITVLYWWAMRVEVKAHLHRLRAGPSDWRSRFAEIRRG
jgi:glycerol-3-phosphate acyltransferase PlsY